MELVPLLPVGKHGNICQDLCSVLTSVRNIFHLLLFVFEDIDGIVMGYCGC
jgi:hypothetical protein